MATDWTSGTRCWYLQNTRKYRCRRGGNKVYYYVWQRVQIYYVLDKRIAVFLVKDDRVVDSKGSTRYVAPTRLTMNDPPEGVEVRA